MKSAKARELLKQIRMLDELIKSDKSAKLKQKTRLINKRAGLILKYIAELATTLAVSIFNSILD